MKHRLLFYVLLFLLCVTINGCTGSVNTVNTGTSTSISQSSDSKENIGVVSNNESSNSTHSSIVDDTDIKTYRIGNTSGNIMNNGLVASQDEWIYYSNIRDGMKLYRIKKDGTEKMKLYDGIVYSLNVLDDWIYCCVNYQPNSESAMLYKIKTDGSEDYELAGAVLKAFVVDDWIYYVDESDAIYRMDIQSSNITKIVDPTFEASNVTFSGGYLYSVGFEDESQLENSYLYRIKGDGSDKFIVMKGYIGDLIVVDGWIYFAHAGFNKVKTDGSKFTKINDIGGPEYNIADGWIYYQNYSDGNKLYKIRIDGTGNIKICDEIATEINVVNDWIYFYTDSPKYEFMRIKKDGTNLQVVE